jgi:hypothetical protein
MSTKTHGQRKWCAYGGPLDGEVGKEDSLGTLPLLLWCGHLVGLQLPLAEVGEGVNDNPRYATTEIDGLQMQAARGSVFCLESMKRERTSWRMKEAMPVAMRGFPIHKYHAIH